MVERIGRTRRYQSTPAGLKAIAALVVLREKAIRPLLAAAQEIRPPADHRTRRHSTVTTKPSEPAWRAFSGNSEWLPERSTKDLSGFALKCLKLLLTPADLSTTTDLQHSHAELRAVVTLLGPRVLSLNFGRGTIRSWSWRSGCSGRQGSGGGTPRARDH